MLQFLRFQFNFRSSYEVFFLVLGKLLDKWGQTKLQEQFDESGIKLLEILPEAAKSESQLAKSLADNKLTFLMPLLSLKEEMESQLDDPTGLAKWIGTNVEAKYHANPDFITALFQVVFKHITDKASDNDAEKDLFTKYRPILNPFVVDKPKLQLAAVYALQMHCNAIGFPKGLLLRSFVNFYEMDILEEHAFLQWKEDVNETYPGKGKALFQVLIFDQFEMIS